MSISDDDAKIRQSWQEGHKVSIFSNSRKKWFDGTVAQIFHDDEGEWLEIRYDKSMSKQVQRYSTDIKPTAQQKADFAKRKQAEKKRKDNAKQKPQSGDVPFPETEMNLRKGWTKNDDVEIFSNTHQEWYRGEIVEIIKDDEGEWLNVVWARNNGEAMSKQVQRFSTDVRPAQDDSDSSDAGGDSLTDKYIREILARQNNFQRRCPLFSRTIQASTFSFPATSQIRNKKKMPDIEEKNEEDDRKKKASVEDWNETRVGQFISNLGRIYAQQYKAKFRNTKGIDLLQLDEKRLANMGLKKLHRLKLLIELAKLTDDDSQTVFENVSETAVLNWEPKRVKKWAAKQPILSQYAINFQRNGVDGMLLFELDSDDLETIGIRPNHRKTFFDTIEELHRISFPNAPPLNTNRTSNSQLDEKDEESNSLSTKPSKGRRQSVMQIDGYGGNSSLDNDRDELLVSMAQLLLHLGNGMIGMPNVKESHALVQSKLDAFQQKLKSVSNMRSSAGYFNGNDNSNSDLADYDVSVDTGNVDDDMDSNSNGKISKIKNRSMERLDDVESPAGMQFARNWINTVDNKKGHRRRQSLPFINNNNNVGMEENQVSDDDDAEDPISDIE